ncbi:hypothetical protein BDM02DRAFT_3123970 [Thelephora ganbajun]|uniref:Uncharacterized protein n=1 Tax=Thelephora ganbajun TaxID=370292 RepID=A0ACB6Z0G8_THEGA|nr:hypothetical protein BDM02DRAFT_3123970 [Thelephora ganbajun]
MQVIPQGHALLRRFWIEGSTAAKFPYDRQTSREHSLYIRKDSQAHELTHRVHVYVVFLTRQTSASTGGNAHSQLATASC